MAYEKEEKEGKMINLKRAPEKISMAAEVPDKAPESYGPTLYINDIPLPLSESDLGEEKEATIKFKLKNISESMRNGKQGCSYDLELTGIKIA